jgi:hypothetical protein
MQILFSFQFLQILLIKREGIAGDSNKKSGVDPLSIAASIAAPSGKSFYHG